MAFANLKPHLRIMPGYEERPSFHGVGDKPELALNVKICGDAHSSRQSHDHLEVILGHCR
jgi:hypothetical protein